MVRHTPNNRRFAEKLEASTAGFQVEICKLNEVDPRAWLGDVLARIADHKITGLADLLPWNGAAEQKRSKLAAQPL